ncbi:methylenetetrahydromethanopterin dehydrogenase [candidate division MSBL1 archaeon SCGC-AAA259E19]|uniref:F420-dependent methylenetetrahydromethanopterin dehydrogenase n=2 Tax=candidate division MSBL1 TaxID=215777 RepID=A0A133UGS7_9EURY|nr:methylenetetrahydromethanopterin dehydrogenase [candidate division MSBL1 archaeon SCGC-AAA259E17]KXA94670.1 methylenetetrahydromethanopterin dehydrogenase [candidate division MSBL1 archaeon SCGC-AAA259E19]
MNEKIRVGFVKLGNIGTSTMLDLMLDERAEREDVDFRVVTSGPQMTEENGREVSKKVLDFDPNLILTASPNPTTPGPSAAREVLEDVDVPCIVIGDAPGAKISEELEEKGFGYIFINADAMIGARREFLDPVEMALFNSYLIKTLAVTGALSAVQEEVDLTISKIKEDERYLPQLIVDRDKSIDVAEFENPYAKTKAMAAFEIASKVADLTFEGCFKIQESEKYIPIVGSAHEMMRVAAKLSDEAREIEKGENSVLRKPHYDDGSILRKRKFLASPE